MPHRRCVITTLLLSCRAVTPLTFAPNTPHRVKWVGMYEFRHRQRLRSPRAISNHRLEYRFELCVVQRSCDDAMHWQHLCTHTLSGNAK